MTQDNMARDGRPMVEKTIFIVKPIYVNAATGEIATTEKKVKQKTRKQIYSEKMRPPALVTKPVGEPKPDQPKRNLAKSKKRKGKRKHHGDSPDDLLNIDKSSPIIDIKKGGRVD